MISRSRILWRENASEGLRSATTRVERALHDFIRNNRKVKEFRAKRTMLSARKEDGTLELSHRLSQYRAEIEAALKATLKSTIAPGNMTWEVESEPYRDCDEVYIAYYITVVKNVDGEDLKVCGFWVL